MAKRANRMNGSQAIRTIVTRSSMTQRAIATKMGRAQSYLSTYLSRNVSPRLDTAAEIANACGWKLMFVNDEGETVEVQA